MNVKVVGRLCGVCEKSEKLKDSTFELVQYPLPFVLRKNYEFELVPFSSFLDYELFMNGLVVVGASDINRKSTSVISSRCGV